LVDAPIVIGTPISATFVVNGRRHDLIAVGDIAQWDGARMAHDLEQVVRKHCRFWNGLP
jgi:predicted metalloprotease with PDZ domain